MRTSTILPLVFIAASVAPSFALPLAPIEEPTTTATSKSTDPARTAHQNEQYAHQKTGLHRTQNTAQHTSPRLQSAHRYTGQRRPERAALASQRLQQRPVALPSRPRPVGTQHYRRPHPSANRGVQPQRQSQQEARAFDEPKEVFIARAVADNIVARDFDEEVFARELEEELKARGINWKKVGTVAGDIGKGLLHFLREDANGELLTRDVDEDLFARTLEEELKARGINWKKVGTVAGDIGKGLLHFLREDVNSELLARDVDEDLLARELEEELNARGINWKKVGTVAGDIGKGLLHFLREDANSEVLARDADEDLFARELEEELKARGINWKKVGTVAGDIGKDLLHFLREDGEMPVYARDLEFDDGVYEREVAPGSGAINFGNILKDGEQFISGVLRRDYGLLDREVAPGSGAINFGNILKDGEQFISGVLRREDEEMLAREFDDELMGRDMILDELD